MIQEIAERVFVQSGRYKEEQRSMVCGRDWCILIDAPRHFDEAEELKQFAREKTAHGVKLAVLTHGHLDHVATLQVFSDITVTAAWATREYMLHKGQEELDRMKQGDPELQKVRQVIPTVTFGGEGIIFDDTGRSLRCTPAPGHSQDSQMIYLENEKIVFGGDILSAVVPPYFPDGSSTRLQESISKFANINAALLVPGHGPILHGEAIQHEAGEAVRYLENLRMAVRGGMDHGVAVEDLQEEIRWQDCSKKPVPPEEYLIFHRENIANMAKEITEEMTALKAGPAWHM